MTARLSLGGGVTFLHGAGSRGLVWQQQLLAFPQAVAPDLPGRDGSPPDTAAGHVAALRTTLDRSTVVVGHSLGGAIALQFALAAPPGLRGLVLMGTGARLRVRPEWLERMVDDYGDVAAELVDHFFAPNAAPRLRTRTLAVLRALPPAVTLADFRAADTFDVRDRLGGALVPCLILCGTEDVLTPPRYAEFLHSALPRSELLLIEGAGHMVMLERPREVNQAVGGFLRRLEEAP